MVNIIRQIFLVPKCKCCFKPADGHNLCDKCRKELAKCRIANPHLPLNKKIDFINECYASYKYESTAADIVKGAKFRNPAPFLASLLDDISIDIKQILAQNNIDMVLPVPSHKSKLYTQEYDLPTEMAKRISRHFGVQFSDCVTKVRKTEKQHNLPRDKRKANLVNAFKVNGDLTGKNILVIDDVITTGFTVSAVATELKLAGREKVYVWCYTLNIERKENT
ncbi:MAG: ComF family protein [Oscillospiraceae bacterium]|nr:ComF family protein [Oscillospiraceae bacterium]